ncbi:MAG: nucleotidyltransferase domain-containing protein [bacterium]
MKKIDLTKKEYEIIKEILNDVPDVCFFGSRVTGKSKKFSDLDICLKKNISDYDYEILKEKFENSDLPFKVDLVEYKRVSEAFKKIIDQECVELSEVEPT